MPFPAKFSSYSTRHAANRPGRRSRGPFSGFGLHIILRGSASGSGELPEDNSSSAAASLSYDRIGSLPLFCLSGGAGWPLPRTFSALSPPR